MRAGRCKMETSYFRLWSSLWFAYDWSFLQANANVVTFHYVIIGLSQLLVFCSILLAFILLSVYFLLSSWKSMIVLLLEMSCFWVLQVRTFRGHTNEKNFVGLTVNSEFIACGSETNEVFVYHKVSVDSPDIFPVISWTFCLLSITLIRLLL